MMDCLVGWILFAGFWVSIFLSPAANIIGAASPFELVLILLGGGLILFALVGGAILVFYAVRAPEEPNLEKPQLQQPTPASAEPPRLAAKPAPTPSSSFKGTPPLSPLEEAVQPDRLALSLEINWQDALSAKIEWKESIQRIPQRQVTFPPINLRLKFLVQNIPSGVSKNSKFDPASVRLSANFDCGAIAAQKNLLHASKFLKIAESSRQCVRGELLLPGPIPVGMNTVTLEGRDAGGAIQRIDLQFICVQPEMGLRLEGEGKTVWVKQQGGTTTSSQPEVETFPPEGLRFSFWAKGLPEKTTRDAWLDAQHPPELIASFALQPHPNIIVRPGTNLLKGGEVLRGTVYTRWQISQLQGTFHVQGPLPDGMHSLLLQLRDDQNTIYSTALEFRISAGALLAVNLAGDRLSMASLVKCEEKELNEDTIQRYLFYLRAALPTGNKSEETHPRYTAVVESLDVQGKPLVPPFIVDMEDEPDTTCLRSSAPLLAYPLGKSCLAGGNILPIPLAQDGCLRASLKQGGIDPLELPVGQLTIDKMIATLEDNGVSFIRTLTIALWFTLPGPDLPTEIYLTLSSPLARDQYWQTSAQPLHIQPDLGRAAGKALVEFHFTGENYPESMFANLTEAPVNMAFMDCELALTIDPDSPLPTTSIRLPLCNLGSLWMEVGEREFNPDEMPVNFSINPLVDGEILSVSLSARPAGAAVSALGSIRLEMAGKCLDRHVVEFEELNTVTGPDGIERYSRLDIEWKPELAALCAGKGAVVFSFSVRAFNSPSNATFWYRLHRSVPSLPGVDKVERSMVELSWQDEQKNRESRQIEGSVFLNQQHSVVLPTGSLVRIYCTLLAKNLYGDLAPIRKGIPLEAELEGSSSGAHLIDGGKSASCVRVLTNESGVAAVTLLAPQSSLSHGDFAFSLIVRPNGGSSVAFPFRARLRIIRRIHGPRQVFANSRHTYELESVSGRGEEAAEWSFYLAQKDGTMQAQPVNTGRGKQFSCEFNLVDNPRGTIDRAHSFLYWIAVRMHGDEEIIMVRALDIDVTPHIDNDVLDLGSRLKLLAQVFPLEKLEEFTWRWELQEKDDDKPLVLAEETSVDSPVSQPVDLLLDKPGNYRLLLDTGNGYRQQVFRVEPMRIYGAHVCMPGDTIRLALRNENLGNAVWTIYRGVDRVGGGTGANLEWRAGMVGYYEVVVDWQKDVHPASFANSAVHRVLVARIYCEPAVSPDIPIPPGGKRRYLTTPAEFRGKKPHWRITYQKGDKRWTEDLGEQAAGIWLQNTGEAEKGYLDASFGSFEDMGEVLTRAVILYDLNSTISPDDRTIGIGAPNV